MGSPAAIKGGLAASIIVGFEEITAALLRGDVSPVAEQTEGVLGRALVSRRFSTEV